MENIVERRRLWAKELKALRERYRAGQSAAGLNLLVVCANAFRRPSHLFATCESPRLTCSSRNRREPQNGWKETPTEWRRQTHLIVFHHATHSKTSWVELAHPDTFRLSLSHSLSTLFLSRCATWTVKLESKRVSRNDLAWKLEGNYYLD